MASRILLESAILIAEVVLGGLEQTSGEQHEKDEEDYDVEDDEAVDETLDSWAESVWKYVI